MGKQIHYKIVITGCTPVTDQMREEMGVTDEMSAAEVAALIEGDIDWFLNEVEGMREYALDEVEIGDD